MAMPAMNVDCVTLILLDKDFRMAGEYNFNADGSRQCVRSWQGVEKANRIGRYVVEQGLVLLEANLYGRVY